MSKVELSVGICESFKLLTGNLQKDIHYIDRQLYLGLQAMLGRTEPHYMGVWVGLRSLRSGSRNIRMQS